MILFYKPLIGYLKVVFRPLRNEVFSAKELSSLKNIFSFMEEAERHSSQSIFPFHSGNDELAPYRSN